ncbi:MAG TPA: hypothetical protein VGE52_01160 [Pirellulales bacterium]
MTADPYSLCPHGTGKKLKFCCGDIEPDREKLEKLLQAGQAGAVAQHIERVDPKFADRTCWLADKARAQLMIGQEGAAHATVEKILALEPKSHEGWALKAILDAGSGDSVGAAESLQNALETIESQLTSMVIEGYIVVGRALAEGGRLNAALLHLMPLAVLDQLREPITRDVMAMLHSPNFPTLLKRLPMWKEAPAEAPFAATLRRAVGLGERGKFRYALPAIEQLAEAHPDSPELLHNLVLARLGSLDDAGAAETLRKLAALPGTPHDEAVELEAFAHTLRADFEYDWIPILSIKRAVNDGEALRTQLLSERRARPARVPVEQFPAESGETPPEWMFEVLEQPADPNAPPAPGVLQLTYFGKRTDRDAFLMATGMETPEFAAAVSWFENLGGAALGGEIDREEIDSVTKQEYLLNVKGRALASADPAAATNALLSLWPDEPQTYLDGKSPRQAAGDPALKTRVEASVLGLEMAAAASPVPMDFATLRAQLGLPNPAPVDGTTKTPMTCTPGELSRVEVAPLSDKAVAPYFIEAASLRLMAKARELAEAIVTRPALEKDPTLVDALSFLVRTSTAREEALKWIEEARAKTAKLLPSNAMWDMLEFEIHMQTGDAASLQKVLQHLATVHGREPEVQEMLQQVMAQAQMLQGRMPGGIPAASSAAAAVPASAPPSSGLWTPDAPASPPAGQAPSKLWMPGMD